MNSKIKRVASLLLALLLTLGTVLPGLAPRAKALTYNGSSSYKSGKYYTALTSISLTGNQRTDIVKIANSQIGYQEGGSSSQLSGTVRGNGSCTEYGRWYGLQDMWCAMFVSWCAHVAGVSTSIVPSHAYTPSGLNWFIQRGQAYSRATVTKGGYTTYTCGCGHSYVGDETDPAGHSYADGVCGTCGSPQPSQITDYYLVGFINGSDYGCESDHQNMGQYRFAEGKLTARFSQDSYVFLKANDNLAWFMCQSYVTESTARLYRTETGAAEKLFVPGGQELTFTLTENSDGSLTLSYAAAHAHSYSAAVTAPTCTGEGYTTYTCECGDSYVADRVAALGHSFQQGICGSCGAQDPDWAASVVLTPKSLTLSLEDEVLYNLYFIVESGTVAADQLGLLVFRREPTVISEETADQVCRGALYDSTRDRYMVTTDGIPGKDLADTLYLVVYAALEDGTFAYSQVLRYSAKTYCMNKMSATDDGLRAMCVALMNYGAAAQAYFAATTDYTYDTPMNQDFAQYQYLVEPYRADMLQTLGSVTPEKAGALGTVKNGFAKRSVSMSADGDFSLNYYFTTEQSPREVTFLYWTQDRYDEVQTLTAENASGSSPMILTDSANRYWTNHDGIAAKEVGQTIYACGIYQVDGVTCSTGVFAYSIGHYCTTKAASGDEALQPFARAIAVYSYYAKQFFG